MASIGSGFSGSHPVVQEMARPSIEQETSKVGDLVELLAFFKEKQWYEKKHLVPRLVTLLQEVDLATLVQEDNASGVQEKRPLLSCIATGRLRLINNEWIQPCFTRPISDEVKKNALYLAITSGNYGFIEAIGAEFCRDCRFTDGHTPLSLALSLRQDQRPVYDHKVVSTLKSFQLSHPSAEGPMKEIYQGRPLWFLYCMYDTDTSNHYLEEPEKICEVLSQLAKEDIQGEHGLALLEYVLAQDWSLKSKRLIFDVLMAKGICEVVPLNLLLALQLKTASTRTWGSMGGDAVYGGTHTTYNKSLDNPIFRRIEGLSITEIVEHKDTLERVASQAAMVKADDGHNDEGCRDLARHIRSKLLQAKC